VILFALDPSRAQRTVAGALAGGIVGGALVPELLGPLGPLLARGSLGLAIAAGALLASGGSRVLLRAAIAGALAVGAVALEPIAPRGISTALLGVGVGLAVAPEGLVGGLFAALVRAGAAGAGALAGAVVLGLAARSDAFAALSPASWGALLGGAIGLGIGAGEVARTFFASGSSVPSEVDEARARLSAETLPLLDSARSSFGKVVESVGRSSALEPRDKIEALATARDLVLSTARNLVASEELARTLRSLGKNPDAEIESGLVRRRERASADAAESAAALSELAVAVAERTSAGALDPVDLAARARGLASRLGSGATDTKS
jgi:hypothetical protein